MGETLNKLATQFNQTDRNGWILKMTAQEITNLLPTRPPEQLSLFTETNRPITFRHLTSIEYFLENTPNWAMPSITLAATPGRIKALKNSIEADSDDLYILDGQHRVQAFSNLIHKWEIDAPRDESNVTQEKLNRITNQELPVVIFEVDSKQDQRQMFAWFARNKPIEPAVREFFDESDPFNKAAKAAMDRSTTLESLITYKVRTVPPKDRDFLSLNNLKDIATTIQLGIRRPAKAEDREACWQQENQSALQQRLVEFFDAFLPSCQPNYQILTDRATFRQKILAERSVSYALYPQVVRLMANAWARWTDSGRQPEPLANCIGSLKMRRADPQNDAENSLQIVKAVNKKFQGTRDKIWDEATTFITNTASDSP